MSKLVLGVAAATLLVTLPVAAHQPVPSHHVWDSWWHDWWHSGLDSHISVGSAMTVVR
jgi:hypothetical protein